jgi:hypothetical protein
VGGSDNTGRSRLKRSDQHLSLADGLAKVLPFRNGNDGFLAAFSLGADGTYPVFAVIRDKPNGPELVRIQVEIAP